MNKKLLVLSVAMFLAVFSINAQDLKTPRPSPMAKVNQEFALGEISLDYSRPSVKGRTVFGDLVPFGKMWRTGANYSTKITVTDIIQIEGNKVEPGTYAIYTIPGKDKWEIMLYSDLKLGGNVAKYDKANEVLRFSVTPTAVTEKVETFTINLADLRDNSATLEMVWENTRVPIKITAEIDETIMANIKKTVIEDNRPYYTAARYYYDNDKDLNKALEWIKIAAAKRPDAYWVKMQQARIEHKLGKKKEAIATAKEVQKIAGEKKNDDYVKMATELIADASK
jgi:hypothetical protein